MIAICFPLSLVFLYRLAPFLFLNMVLTLWLYRRPVGFDGLFILQGHFLQL